MELISISWINKSLISAIGIILYMLMFPYFIKSGVKSELVVFGWFGGVIIGMVISVLGGGYKFTEASIVDFTSNLLPLIVIIVLGITIGAPSNVLLGQAFKTAPNPALPFAIVNSGTVVTYILAPFLFWLLPKYFDKLEFTWTGFIGVLFVIVGFVLIMIKK